MILALAIFLHESRTVSCIDVALAMASKYCVMERVKRMLTYSCHDLKLKEVPQYLKSGVEVGPIVLPLSGHIGCLLSG